MALRDRASFARLDKLKLVLQIAATAGETVIPKRGTKLR